VYGIVLIALDFLIFASLVQYTENAIHFISESKAVGLTQMASANLEEIRDFNHFSS